MFIVGFDLGKRKSQICLEDDAGNVLAQLRVSTTRQHIAAALERYPKARVLLESSTSSEWVAQFLEQLGCDVVVGDPRFSPMYAHGNKKIKTDKRDAKALADALRMGAFRRAHRRSLRAREIQTMLLGRRSLITSRTALINLVRSATEREGIRVGPCHKGDYFLAELFNHVLPDWLANSLAPAVEQIASLTDQIDSYDRIINKIAQTDPVALLLQSVPGVGPLTSLAFMAVVDDPSRFSSATEVVAYIGLAPGQRNSGESKRRPGAITKAGDSVIRGYLYEAAVNITRVCAPSTPLKDWGLRLKAKNENAKRKALVGVARRLARILWAMWRDNKPFNPTLTAPAELIGAERKDS